MPKVTLRYAVLDANKTLHRFSKETDLPIDPHQGLIINDRGMPSPIHGPSQLTENENMVACVRANIMAGTIVVELLSGHDGSMTADELALSYQRHGWKHDCGPAGCNPQVYAAEPAADGEEDT